MPNLHDYVLWRGDLPIEVSPLCEVDDLLFSQLAYVSFGPFVPGPSLYPQYVTLGAAAERLLEYDPEGTRIHQHAFMWKNVKKLLEMCAASRRYRSIRLCAYVDELSDHIQFAALCMQVTAQVSVIAFRGTDDSIAGWKEDMLMALDDPIPAQLRAAEYLRHLAPHLQGKIALTGHSKGGNLAVFSASRAPEAVQKRIFRIANLDGPGFSKQLLTSPGYHAIREKLSVMLPESSVIGRLLEHESDYHIIRSTALGIMQHDAFSWQVQGAQLIRASEMTAYSEYTSAVMRSWLDGLSTEQRREFMEAVFEMFSSVEAKKLKDAPAAILSSLPQIVRKMATVDKENRENMVKVLLGLGQASLKSLHHNIRAQGKELLGDEDDAHLD